MAKFRKGRLRLKSETEENVWEEVDAYTSPEAVIFDDGSNVNERIEALENNLDNFINPFTVTFNIAPSVAEKGSTVSSVNATWTYNKDIKSQSFNDTIIDIISRSRVVTGMFNTDTTFKLTATTKTKVTQTKTATLKFLNGIYYGSSSSTNYNNALIASLTKTLSDSKNRTITVNAGSEQYIYYAYPSRLGNASFVVGGFEGGFSKVATIEYTNPSGFAENYNIYKSDNASLGNTNITIK